jgi:vitamin B12 transporter
VSGVFLRGSNANHVVLLIDGVRINSATAGTNAFENIPLEQIERIEILRGPASSLYGADAIGGVIQIFTRREPRTQARLGAGRWKSREGSVGLGRELGATRWSLQAGYRESDSFSATSEGHPFSFDPDDDAYRNSSLGLSASHDWAEDQTLAASLLHSDGTTRFDGGAGDVNRQKLTTASIESRNRLHADWRSTLRIARGRDDIDTDGSFPSRFRTEQDQASWQNDVAALGGQWVAGLEWRRERVDSSTAYTRDRRTVRSAFGAYSAEWQGHLLQASVRRDDNSQFGAHTTGNLAYGLRLTPAWRLSASAGSAFKAPSFNDLYFPLSFGFSGNPDLEPERSRSAELGARYEAQGVQAGLTLFHTRIRELIAVDPSFSTVVNVNRARIRGATLHAAIERGDWTARGEFTHQDPRDAETDRQLVLRARRHASASLVFAPQPWRAGIELVASDTRYGTAANTPDSRLGGYALLNLHAGYALSREWSVSVRLNNAADKRYELVQDYNTPRRNVFVALDYAAK